MPGRVQAAGLLEPVGYPVGRHGNVVVRNIDLQRRQRRGFDQPLDRLLLVDESLQVMVLSRIAGNLEPPAPRRLE